MGQILDGLRWLKNNRDLPSVLISNTVKGKGVSYMENNPKFHGAAPNEEQYHLAMKELGGSE